MKKLLTILPLLLLLSFMVGCTCNTDCKSLKAQAELEERNLEIVRQVWTEWNNKNIDFFTTDYERPDDKIIHSPVGTTNPPMSHEEMIESIKTNWAAFPDDSTKIIDMIASGDKVITTYISKGTHKGEYNGVPATGKKFESGGIGIVRIKDGVIVEEWDSFDDIGFWEALGFELQPKVE